MGRIFKYSPQAWVSIAGEMINLEAGKLIYENGKMIPKKKQRPYPKIRDGNCTITCKLNIGVLYIPADIPFEETYSKLHDLLDKMEPENHLMDMMTLETGSRQFCAVEVKSLMSGTTDKVKAGCWKRRITNTDDPYQSFSGARFIWMVKSFPNCIFNKKYSVCQPTDLANISTIVFDSHDLLVYKNNSYHLNIITPMKFRAYDLLLYLKDNDGHNLRIDYVLDFAKERPILHKIFKGYNTPTKGFHDLIRDVVYVMKWKTVKKTFVLRHVDEKKRDKKELVSSNPGEPYDSLQYQKEARKICFDCECPLYHSIYVLIDGDIYVESKPYTLSPTAAMLMCAYCFHSRPDSCVATLKKIIRCEHPTKFEKILENIKDDLTRKFVQAIRENSPEASDVSNKQIVLRHNDQTFILYRTPIDFISKGLTPENMVDNVHHICIN